MGLSSVVRPFVEPVIQPPPVPAKAEPTTSDNCVITCGQNGNIKTFSGQFRLDITYYQIKKPKEKKASGGGGGDAGAGGDANIAGSVGYSVDTGTTTLY